MAVFCGMNVVILGTDFLLDVDYVVRVSRELVLPLMSGPPSPIMSVVRGSAPNTLLFCFCYLMMNKVNYSDMSCLGSVTLSHPQKAGHAGAIL